MNFLASLTNLLGPDLWHEPETLRRGVRDSYSRAATAPGSSHPFPIGDDFALSLGYPRELLATIPPRSRKSFVGVANSSVSAQLPGGATVLDIGCGAGLDALIAARRVGPHGRVIGLDFSPDMLSLAGHSARETGLTNLQFICGEAERLPLTSGSVDIVLINGIFNLNPDRAGLFREISRVTRTGGMVHAAELVLTGPLRKRKLRRVDDWFS